VAQHGHRGECGLAVSQNILERHGGRIEVESVPGKGTTFTVTLPVESSGMPLVAAMGEATKTKSR